jgi:serine/threonine protein kinase
MQPGTQISHYEILSAIGRGGMGEVWKARDTRLGREVAIKTLPPEFSENKDHLARFRREAQAASALNHPNICVVYDLDEHEGHPFIVMELLKGETLKEKLERGPMAIDQALDVGAQLADGLDAAHTEGIIHRDIKPANIFVTERGIAKLLDFGLARVQVAASPGAPTVDDITNSGTVLGTVSYMSPEQARGEELDARSDLFSLGVVFYEMTTGQPAFTGNTTAVIFERLFNKVVDPPTRLNPSLPRDLDTMIEKLIAKDRGQRMGSAGELRTDIKRLRRESDSRNTPPSNVRDTDTGKKSIAVLPFKNQSADPENEYFSDGLTDEIITDLSQIKTLRVISQNSSMQFKGSGKDLKTVASDLNVRYVLEGTVRKAANAVRVTVRLIDPALDEHLWAEKYSGKLEDIFEIQEQISRKIVDALKMQLSPQEDKKLAERPIDNVEAFECYHKARREAYKFTEEGADRALELIQRAIDIVGDNELLYAAMGSVYRQYFNAAIKSDDDLIDKAEECARKVFEINPDSAAGHELLGMVRLAQGRTAESVRSFKTALAIRPDSMYALMELGRVYEQTGYYVEGRSMVQKSLAIDPLSAIAKTALICFEMFAGHMDVVDRDGPELLATIPEFPMLRWVCAMSLIHGGHTDKALEVLGAAPAENTPTISGLACLMLELGLKGRRSDAVNCVNPELLERARKVEWWCWTLGETYAAIGESDLAIDWLEVAVERGFINHPYFSKHSQILRKLDDDPRFQKLLRKAQIAWEQFEP